MPSRWRRMVQRDTWEGCKSNSWAMSMRRRFRCFLRCRWEYYRFCQNLRTRFGGQIYLFFLPSAEARPFLVIALDTNPTRLALARHNAQIYGVADRIEFIQADYISFARAYLSSFSTPSPSSNASTPPRNKTRKIDVVFLSPPWGGPSYLSGSPSHDIVNNVAKDNLPQTDGQDSHPTYSFSSIQPIHGKDLFTLTRRITSNIAYYLPRNTDLPEISDLLNATDDHGRSVKLSGERIEVEEEWMGSKLKALTCYFGGLVAGQEDLFS